MADQTSEIRLTLPAAKKAPATPPPPPGVGSSLTPADWDAATPITPPTTPPQPAVVAQAYAQAANAAAPPVQTTPTSTLTPADWDAAKTIFPTPPSTVGLPPLPKSGPPHPVVDFLGEYAPPILGATLAASEIGPLVKGAPAAIGALARFGAAGAGGMTGSAIADTLARNPHAPPLTPQQVAERAGLNAVTAGAGEALPTVAGTVLKTLPARYIARAARRGATPTGREIVDYLGRIGASPIPGHLAPDSPFLQVMENVMQGSFISRGTWHAAAQQTEDAFVRHVDDILSQYGGRVSPSEAGQVIKDAKIGEAIDTAQRGVQQAQRLQTEAAGQVAQARAATATGRQAVSARLGPPPGLETTATLSQRLIAAADEAAQRASNLQYNQLWQATEQQGLRADPTKLFDRAQQLLDQTGELGASQGVLGRSKSALTGLSQAAEAGDEAAGEAIPGVQYLQNLASGTGAPAEAARSQLQELLGITGGDTAASLSPRQLNQLRSFYGRMAHDLTGPARGHFAQLAKAAEETLVDTMGGETSDFVKEFRVANQAYRTMKETFTEGALAKAADANPRAFLQSVTGATTESVKDITTARRVLDSQDPTAWKKVQAEMWHKIAAHPDGSPVSSAKLLSNLKGIPDEQLRAIFGGEADTLTAIKPLIEAEQATVAATRGSRDVVSAATKAGTDAIAAAKGLDPFTLVSTALDRASGESIAKLRTLVGDEGWKKVQALKLEQYFAGDGPDSIVQGKKLFQRLPPLEQLQEIFPRDRANFLYQFARVRKAMAAESALGGGGKIWIQLATPGAIAGVAGAATGLYTGDPTKALLTGTVILLTPRMLAKIATSPEMGKALLTGMAPTIVHTPGAGRVAYQTLSAVAARTLAAYLVRQGLINADGTPTSGVGSPPPAAQGPGTRGTTSPTLRGSTPGRAGGPGPRAGVAPPPAGF